MISKGGVCLAAGLSWVYASRLWQSGVRWGLRATGLLMAASVLHGCCDSTTTGTWQLSNQYFSAITELYLSPIDSPNWGANILDAPIPVGATLEVTCIEPGYYDWYVVAANGRSSQSLSVYFSAGNVTYGSVVPSDNKDGAPEGIELSVDEAGAAADFVQCYGCTQE